MMRDGRLNMDRRRYLAVSATLGYSIITAGCSKISSAKNDTRVVKLSILNEDNKPHEATVVLSRDGKAVYEGTISLEEEQKNAASDTKIIEPPAFEPASGDWSLTIELETNQSDQFDLNTLEGRENCIWPTILITAEGELALSESFEIESCPPN